MKIAIIGRTSILLQTAKKLIGGGHKIAAVWTCKSEDYYKTYSDDFAILARKLEVPFRNDLGINTRDGIDWLKDTGAEIGVSANWLTLIGEEAINALPRKILNVHAGDLPKYRGNACVNWAIINGEERIGVTIHEMVAELDAGPIVLKRYIPVTDRTYTTDIFGWLDAHIPSMFLEAIDGLEAGTITPVPQSTEATASLRCYPRRPEDGKINWSHPVNDIHRLVRATSRPFDGAFTTLEGGRKVVIWRAEPVRAEAPFCAVPGQVCSRVANDPVIACGEGLLRLTEVTVDGCDTNEEGKAVIHKSLRNRLI